MAIFFDRKSLAVKLAQEAGRAILEIQQGDMKTCPKGHNDVVTIADTTAENMIVDAIRESFPNDAIIAEEGGVSAGTTGYTWVIDPLDGTVNFSRGMPLYAVSIGYLRDGQPEGGAIYIPRLDELFTCERGRGTYLNGKKISVSKRSLRDSVASIDIHNRVPDTRPWLFQVHNNLMENVLTVEKLFSAVICLCYVACGRMEIHFCADLFIWDMMPACLMITEAGGTVTQPDGTGFDYLQVKHQNILATNGVAHAEVIKLVKK
jgi:myo-inositol-1(or 4)-monophosphatase